MSLPPGTRLGRYELQSLRGAGGMGQVYRAHDTRLGRDVAIKVLPDGAAADPTRRQRFEREARAASALGHPHICTVHDLDHQGDIAYLVTEWLDGSTVQERLRSGAMPLHESLARATEIADALRAVHRAGIVHRDLKPANVMLTTHGAKLLDFGIAAIRPPQPPVDDRTATAELTRPGLVTGTPGYMSPEQRRGDAVDARTDLFALGALLYEMLTGTRALPSGRGLDAANGDAVAGGLEALSLPQSLKRVIEKCLAADPDDRWQTAHDLRDALQWTADAGALNGTPELGGVRSEGAPRRWTKRLAVLIALSLAAATGWTFARGPDAEPVGETLLDVVTPPTPDASAVLSVALSADGKALAFVAVADGVNRLWVRRLDSATATPIKGTEGAAYPFWKPDGRAIGFFAQGMLKRVDAAGGAVQDLAPASAGRGGAWSPDGTIVFAPSNIGPLSAVSDTWGTPSPVTHLVPQTQSAHRFPEFLPDGEHLVFFAAGPVDHGVYLASRAGGGAIKLVTADTAGALTSSGHLLFVRGGTLYAQPLDQRRLVVSGEPVAVAESVVFQPGKGAFAASATGSIVYRAGSQLTDQLVWLDRAGTQTRMALEPDPTGLFNPAVSADGRVLLQRTADGNDIWLVGGPAVGATRATDDSANDWCPVWHPDGRRFAFTSNRTGVFDLFQQSLTPGAPELLVSSSDLKIPTDWSRDGRFLLYRVQRDTRSDLWVLPLGGTKTPLAFADTRFDEREGQFSPDGRWVAYQSDESGRFEIYLQPFPGPGERIRVTANGGVQPRWRPDGRELFFVGSDEALMALSVEPRSDGSAPHVGGATKLFDSRISGGLVPGANRQQYAVSPDGQQFLMSVRVSDTAPSLTIVLNWTPK